MADEKVVMSSNTFERHTQTALVLLLVALLLWVGDTTQKTAVSVAEMRVELSFLKIDVNAPVIEHAEYDRQLGDLRQRVSGLENREHVN